MSLNAGAPRGLTSRRNWALYLVLCDLLTFPFPRASELSKYRNAPGSLGMTMPSLSCLWGLSPQHRDHSFSIKIIFYKAVPYLGRSAHPTSEVWVEWKQVNECSGDSSKLTGNYAIFSGPTPQLIFQQQHLSSSSAGGGGMFGVMVFISPSHCHTWWSPGPLEMAEHPWEAVNSSLVLLCLHAHLLLSQLNSFQEFSRFYPSSSLPNPVDKRVKEWLWGVWLLAGIKPR